MNTATRALLNLQALEFSEPAAIAASATTSPLTNAVGRLRSRVSKQTLVKYDSRKRRYGSSSVVPLKRGICAGCRVAVSQATRLNARKGLVECEHCGRLLYATGRPRPLRLEEGWAT